MFTRLEVSSRNVSPLMFCFLLFFSADLYGYSYNDYRWIGATWGLYSVSNNWQRYDGVNWITALEIPTDANSSTIYISSGSSVEVNSSVTVHIFSAAGATLKIDTNCVVHLIHASSIDGYLPSLIGPGMFSVESGAVLDISGGTIASNAILTIQSGGSALLDGNPFSGTGTITNYGNITYNTTYINFTGTINNYGTFNATSTGTSSALINNYGSLNILSGTGNAFSCIINHTSGQITVNANCSMSISAVSTSPVTEAGTINVNSGATLSFSNAYSYSCSFIINSSINGSGTMRYACSTATISGTYNITGVSRFSGGTTTFLSTASVNSLGSLTADGGIVYFNAGLTLNGVGSALSATNYGYIYLNTGRTYTFNSVYENRGGFGGSDSIIIKNSFGADGGSLLNTSVVTLDTGCITTFATNPTTINGKLINNGTINFNANNGINGTGSLVNNGIMNCLAVSSCGVPYTNSAVGKIISSSTSTNFTFTSTVNIQGTITITAGTLSIAPYNASGTVSAAISTSPGSTLYFGNSLTINGSLSAGGTVIFYGTINYSGTYNNTGTTSITSGTTTFTAASNLSNIGNINASGGIILFSSASPQLSVGTTVNISGSATVEFSTGLPVVLHNVVIGPSGTLRGSDDISIDGSLDHQGYLYGSGKRIILASATVNWYGNGFLTSATLYNYGTFNWTAASIKSTGSIDNRNVFNILTASGACISMTNNGVINKTQAASTGEAGFSSLTNNGTINIQYGTLSVSAGSNNSIINVSGGTFLIYSNLTSAGQFNIGSGAVVTGSAYQINYTGSALTNNGTISVGTLQFGGTTSLSGTGSINSSTVVSGSGNVTLQSGHKFKSITISSGGKLDISSDTLYLSGSGTPITNNGTLAATNGIIEYNGTAAQSVATTNITYGGLSINNPAAGVSLAAAYSFNGTLYLTNGAFNNAAYLTMANNSTIIRYLGTLQSAPVIANKINIHYRGISATVSGNELPSGSTAIGLLKIANSGGVTLSKSVQVNDSLVFSAGRLVTTANYTLTLSPAARMMGESNSGYLIGNVTASASVGFGASSFSNIGVQINAGVDNIGTVTVTRVSGPGGAVSTNGYTGINRQWMINPAAQPVNGRTLIFSWPAVDDGGHSFTSANKAELWSYYGTQWGCGWDAQDISISNPHVFTAANVTEMQKFTLSDTHSPFKNRSAQITAFAQGLFNGSSVVPDTLRVYFAASVNPYAYADTITGLTTTDGTITASPARLINGSSYYIVAKNKNSIETWSAAPVLFTGNSITYDFSSSKSQAFAGNLVQAGPKWCLWSGDVNQDGVVDNTDLSLIINDADNFTAGYKLTDLNGDNYVDFSDISICDNAAYALAKTLKPGTGKAPAVRAQQK